MGAVDPDAILDWLAVCSYSLVQIKATVIDAVKNGGTIPTDLSVDELINATEKEIEEYFDDCSDELELAAVLQLVASAEARIKSDARLRWEKDSDALATALKNIYRRSMLDERFVPLYDNGILEEWQTFLSNLQGVQDPVRNSAKSRIGGLKDPWRLRNWIAHGRSWPLAGSSQISNFPPIKVSEVIQKVFDALRDAAALGRIRQF